MINCIAICVRRKKAKRAMLAAHHDAAANEAARTDLEELVEYQREVIADKEASRIPSSYFAPPAHAEFNRSK